MSGKSVGIGIFNTSNFATTKLCIDNLLQSTKYPIKLYVYDCDEEFNLDRLEYFKNLPNDPYYFAPDSSKNLNQLKSDFIQFCNEDFICILPITCLVGNGWVEDLIYNYNQFENVGIISIKSNETKCQITALPSVHTNSDSEAIFKNVWVSENSYISGLMFFEQKLSNMFFRLSFGKLHNTSLYDDKDLSIMSNLLGLNNFYIFKQNVIYLNTETEVSACDSDELSYLEIEFKKYVNNIFRNK